MNVVKHAALATITSPTARSFAAPAAIGFVGGTISGAVEEQGVRSAPVAGGLASGAAAGAYLLHSGLLSRAPTREAFLGRAGTAWLGVMIGLNLGDELGSRIS